MKKRYRERALNEIFARLQSEDFDRREHALFQLSILLQRSGTKSSGLDLPYLDDENLPRELQRIRLVEDEQTEIVARLALLIASRRESRATALWTLGAIDAEAGWPQTVTVLKACGTQLDDEAAFQACRTLSRWLASTNLASAQIEASAANRDLAELVGRWAAAGSPRLRREAETVLTRLRARGTGATHSL